MLSSRSSCHYHYLLKILLVGNSGVGKSSILMRFSDKTFEEQYIYTIGVDFKVRTIEVNGKVVKLQIWDTAGQERFRAFTSAYYRGAQGIIMVYDITNRLSFHAINNWLNDIRRFANNNPEVDILLIGNKCDQKDQRCVGYREAMQLANELDVLFMECSAKDGTNIDAAFLLIATKIIVNMSEKESQEFRYKSTVDITSLDTCWGDFGLHGSGQVRTPNLDVLASNGIILNNYYVSPICSPSRGAILSARHPIHTGLQHGVFAGAKPEGLPLQCKILPQYLKELGYETHAVGKWHQGFFRRPYIPTQRGFDSHFGYWTGHEDYFDRTSDETDGHSLWGIDFHDNEDDVPIDQYLGLYSTHIYTNKSVDIILNKRKNSSKPLFLYLAHQSVHAGNGRQPLQVPQQYIDRFGDIADIRRRTFVAMVSALDESIGQIVSALQRAGILNNTIIIFTTDNGGAVGKINGKGIDNSMGSNWPLRGAKYTLFEGGIRGNAFIWSPLLKQQYVSNHLMHIQDWLPTIYSAIGGQHKDLGYIDGIDMWHILNNNEPNPRQHLLHNIDDIWKVWALRDGNYKLLSGSTLGGQFDNWFLPPGETKQIDAKHFESNQLYYKNCLVHKVLERMNFTLKSVKPLVVKCEPSQQTECKPTEKPCLFDISSDPCEYNNLFDQKPQIVESMLRLLLQYNSSAVEPIVRAYSPDANPVLHNYRWVIWQ